VTSLKLRERLRIDWDSDCHSLDRLVKLRFCEAAILLLKCFFQTYCLPFREFREAFVHLVLLDYFFSTLVDAATTKDQFFSTQAHQVVLVLGLKVFAG
jgi:hypothetical protein